MEESPIDLEAMRQEIALFRLSLVASLASPYLERGELRAAMRKLAKRHHKIPGTPRTKVSTTSLKRWLRAYKRYGLEGNY